MKLPSVLVLLLAGIVANASIIPPNLTALSQEDKRKIRVQDIKSLTFKAGKFAARLRGTPALQLNCIRGCTGEQPTAIQCENKGFDGLSVSWTCTANVAKGRKLENSRVRCEAFTEGDPEFIVAGSCVVDFDLGGRPKGGGREHPVYPVFKTSSRGGSPVRPLQYIVPIIMVIIFVVIICAIVKACRNDSGRSGVVIGPPSGQPGGFPVAGGAYPTQPGFNPSYQPGYAAPMAAPSRGGTSALGAGVGGFAAGAATGGLLGYMMGNHGSSGHGYGHSYGTYGGGGGGDYSAGDMDGGGGYEMSTDFADTVME